MSEQNVLQGMRRPGYVMQVKSLVQHRVDVGLRYNTSVTRDAASLELAKGYKYCIHTVLNVTLSLVKYNV